MASDVSLNTALQNQQKTADSKNKLADDFTQFLTLLTIQLQNQDPLSPMDTTEFTNQLVAFTGVEQQINANQKLDALVAMGLGNAFTGALQYVGLDVSYLSSEFQFAGAAKPAEISYALDKQSVETKISIYDETDKLVYSTKGSGKAGVNEFVWDGTTNAGGKAPAGTYEIKIDAIDSDDKGIKSSIVVNGSVRGVETQNGTLFLLVGDRAVPVANVLNASQPKPPAQAGTA